MFLKNHANFDTSPRPEMNCKCQSGFQQRNAWKRETPQETKETQTTERRLWEQPLDRLEITPKKLYTWSNTHAVLTWCSKFMSNFTWFGNTIWRNGNRTFDRSVHLSWLNWKHLDTALVSRQTHANSKFSLNKYKRARCYHNSLPKTEGPLVTPLQPHSVQGSPTMKRQLPRNWKPQNCVGR